MKNTLWTPNRLAYEVNVPAATSLVINQNFYPGWRLAAGPGSIYADGTLLAVHIPSGSYQIEIVYAPPHILFALALTLFASVVLIVMWRFETRRA